MSVHVKVKHLPLVAGLTYKMPVQQLMFTVHLQCQEQKRLRRLLDEARQEGRTPDDSLLLDIIAHS